MTIPVTGRRQQGRRTSRRAGLGLMLLTALGLAAALALGLNAAAGPAPQPRLRPVRAATGAAAHLRIGSGEAPTYTVAPGGELTVTVAVVDAANLGAAAVLLAYDPTLVQAVACTPFQPVGVDLSVCNPIYGSGVVRYALAAGAGLHGSQPLFTLTFRAIGPAGATTALALAAPEFADPLGAALPVTTAGGAISIAGAALPPDARVYLTPQHAALRPGEHVAVTVTVDVTASHPLAAATFLLQYDPRLVRPVQCLPAPDSPLLGGCNANFNPTQGLVKFNVLAAEGAWGQLPLYAVLFAVATAPTQSVTSPLTMTVASMVGVANGPLRWQAEHGAIAVQPVTVDAAQIMVGNFTVKQGETITVGLWVENVFNLGAATLALTYDPTQVQPLRCATYAELGDGGYCDIRHGQVVGNIIAGQGLTITELRPVFGVIFTPVASAPAGTRSPLTVAASNFVDANAAPLPWRPINGSVKIAQGDLAALPLISVGPVPAAGPLLLAQDGGLTVTLTLSAVTKLGAATVAVAFDPAVATAVACRPLGAFDSSACHTGAGAVTASLLTAAGFTGAAPIAELALQSAAGAQVGDQTDLRLAVTNFSDVAGKALPYQLAGNTVVITAPLGAPAHAVVRLHRDLYDNRPGERFAVRLLALLDTTRLPYGLDAATLFLRYDPTVARPVTCAVNDAAFQIGACNLGYGADRLRINLVGGLGLTGAVALAGIEFEAVGPVGAAADLVPVVEQLIAVGGLAPASRNVGSRVQISSDGDGVPDWVEAGAPNQGDGNGDGIPDRLQADVASLPTLLDGRYVTLVAPAPACLKQVQFVSNPGYVDTPYGWAFPLGFLHFTVNCLAPGGAALVELRHDQGPPLLDQFFIYVWDLLMPGRGWQSFHLVDGTGAEFAADRIHLHLADGLRGDNDAVANGEIFFLGAPAHSGAGVNVVPASLNLVEGGPPASYQLSLLARPAAPVTVALTMTGPALVTPDRLAFAVDNWAVAQTVTVSAVNDAVFAGVQHATIHHGVNSSDGLYNGLVAPSVTVTITDDDPPPTPMPPQTVHLPVICQRAPARPGAHFLPLIARPPLPDLVVAAIRWAGARLELVVANVGTAPVGDEFWVEAYIAPRTPPTAVNQTWDALGAQGLAWGVTAPALPLLPGQQLVLTVGDAYFWPAYSAATFPLPPGTPLYAQVDSYAADTAYGAVLEGHEQAGQAYNNILGPVLAPAGATERIQTLPARPGGPGRAGLPPR